MALQVVQTTRHDFSLMVEQADTLVKSGFLPQSVNTPQKAVAIMMMGQELGITPWMAFNGINVIQGKPTVSPQLMLALIYRSGESEEIHIDGDDKQCAVTMKRKGQGVHTETFTMAMAAQQGLAGKANWRKMPAIMLKWRAVSACARIVYPDIIMGFYTPEEISPEIEVSGESGEAIVVVEPPPDDAEQVVGNPATPAPKPANGNPPKRDPVYCVNHPHRMIYHKDATLCGECWKAKQDGREIEPSTPEGSAIAVPPPSKKPLPKQAATPPTVASKKKKNTPVERAMAGANKMAAEKGVKKTSKKAPVKKDAAKERKG